MRSHWRSLRGAITAALIVGVVGVGGVTLRHGGAGVDPCAGFSFCDEFSGSSLDTSKWVAVNSHGDLSNSESECYTGTNVAEGGGLLTETVENRAFTCPDTTGANNYPSGAIQMKSFSFLYGTVEVRARMAGCGGCWPAIWLLGSDCQSPAFMVNGNDPPGCNWPQAGSQEIDIAEFFSSASFTSVHNAAITSGGSTANFGTSAITDASTNFHVYTLVWAPGSATFKVDGVQVNHFTSNVASTPCFLIVNTAIGGNGGTIVNSTLPKTTQIDYVHVTS